MHTKLRSLKMELPEGVKAYRLLHSANMTDEEIRLCLATIKEFKYEDMKIQLMKICGDEVSCSSNESLIKIKEEPVCLVENDSNNGYQCNRSNHERISNEQRFDDRNNAQYRSRNETESSDIYYTENHGNRFNNSYNRSNRWNNRSRNNRGNRRGGGGNFRGRGSATPRREMNPTNSDGEVCRCSYCGSKFHFRSNCPELDQNPQRNDNRNNTNIVGMCENSERIEEINLYNVLQSSANELDGLVGETIGMAVVDSGCSKTVAGKEWLELFKETLSNEEIDNLVIQPSKQLFKFGEGQSVKSEGKVKLPAMIGSKRITVDTEIIQANIPMLLSKESMKKAGTIINFNTDEIQILGETHNLISTKSGHYAIPLTTKSNINDDTYDYNVTLVCKYNDEELKDPMKIADKLH